MGQASGFHPLQPEVPEGKGERQAHRGPHVPLLGVRGADPIAERRRLGDAAAQEAEGEPADEPFVAFADQEEGISLVAPHLLGVALDAAPEAFTRQFIGRPNGFPSGQEVPALFPSSAHSA